MVLPSESDKYQLWITVSICSSSISLTWKSKARKGTPTVSSQWSEIVGVSFNVAQGVGFKRVEPAETFSSDGQEKGICFNSGSVLNTPFGICDPSDESTLKRVRAYIKGNIVPSFHSVMPSAIQIFHSQHLRNQTNYKQKKTNLWTEAAAVGMNWTVISSC